MNMNIVSQRLYNQHVVGPQPDRPEKVVEALGAVQAQDYGGAKWSVGQRVANGTDADVEEAYTSGRLLRTHLLRPTWHFVAPRDIRWMLAVTAQRVHALNVPYYRKFELDEALLARCHALFLQVLGGGNQLTRLELAAILEREGIVADKLRLSYIMMHAELEGLICSGAMRGKQHTYALLEEWVPPTTPISWEEGLAELTRRFFVSHGPATLREYTAWAGLTVTNAKLGLEIVKPELSSTVWEGRTYWFSAGMEMVSQATERAFLLPEYDECLIAYKDFSYFDMPSTIDMQMWRDVWYRPIIIEGRRAGTWRRTVLKEKVVVEMNLFTSLNDSQIAMVQDATERLGVFMQMPVDLETQPQSGNHPTGAT